MQEFNIFSLRNGIKVIHHGNNSKVSHLGLLANVGSRDEDDNEHGLAHYLEHCFFKGTKKRKPFHILNRLEVVGGEINAYTTKEETCIYGSFLNEHLDRATELISDIICNSTFPEKEIIKEKEIIIDEIYSYQDSPIDQIYDDFEQQIFNNHTIGRPILGTEKSVKKLTQQQLLNFVKKYYHPENIVISCVSNVNSKKLNELLEKYFGAINTGSSAIKRQSFSSYQPQKQSHKKDLFQNHCMIGNIAYPIKNTKRRGLVLLNNILGGPTMNSRLSMSLREKHGYTYNIESNYTPYSDTGIFSIYLGTETKWLDKSIKLAYKELKLLRENKLGTTQLANAKKQLIGQIALGQENRSNLMLSIGKSLMNFKSIDSLETITKKINEITAEQLLEIANEVFDEKQISMLTFLKNEEKN